ncbi:glutaredoxin family protein [Chitinimonas sp.]|uniref:glutaredoxin family protein n=1 Tax=Chitinimonas sp. TaxID=1934313 RepID=UPI0035B24702
MRRLLLALLILSAPFALAGKVYQWKDANGNIVFSDTPPPDQKAQSKDIKTNVIQTSGGGFDLKEAMRKSPVILWANNCGESCDSARLLLSKRGVPYGLRNPQASPADLEALKKILSGDAVVPVLQVGATTLRGFEPESWQGALDNAGYPKSADPTAKNISGPTPVAAPAAPAAKTPAKP